MQDDLLYRREAKLQRVTEKTWQISICKRRLSKSQKKKGTRDKQDSEFVQATAFAEKVPLRILYMI